MSDRREIIVAPIGPRMSPRAKTPEVTMLPVGSLTPSGLNPRLDVGDVTELADSIRELGILVPLLVAPFGEGYVVIAGHRRLKAAKVVKLADVPAIVREASELERLELMLVENQQRVPLTPVEEGIAYARILKNHPITQAELAAHVGVSQTYVSSRLAVLNLPKAVVQQVHRGELPVDVALGYREDTRGRITPTQKRIPIAYRTPVAPFPALATSRPSTPSARPQPGSSPAPAPGAAASSMRSEVRARGA